MEKKSSAFLVGMLVLVVLSLITVFALSPFVIVGAGERGVVLEWGEVQPQVLGEGLHWRTPIKTRIEQIDVKTQKEEVEALASSRDLQGVKTIVAVNYRIDAQSANLLYQEVGPGYGDTVIAPAIQESVKAATALFSAEELVTDRPSLREAVLAQLRERLQPYHLVVQDVSIVDFKFSDSFNAAIESKVTAEQKALEAENKLAQVEFEAQQKVASAQAEAESVRLQAQALSENPQFIELRALEVRLEMARQWNGILPQNIYAGAPIPFLEIIN